MLASENRRDRDRWGEIVSRETLIRYMPLPGMAWKKPGGGEFHVEHCRGAWEAMVQGSLLARGRALLATLLPGNGRSQAWSPTRSADWCGSGSPCARERREKAQSVEETGARAFLHRHFDGGSLGREIYNRHLGCRGEWFQGLSDRFRLRVRRPEAGGFQGEVARVSVCTDVGSDDSPALECEKTEEPESENELKEPGKYHAAHTCSPP